MLVLSRKKNESIVINDNITVVIVDVRGDKVRLGVDAPSNVTVHRKEIFDVISKETLGLSDVSEPQGATLPLSNSVSLSEESDTATVLLEPRIGIKTEPLHEKSGTLDRELQPRTKPISKKTFKKK